MVKFKQSTMFSKYKSILYSLVLGVFVFLLSQGLIYYYVYPSNLPEGLFASVLNTIVSSFKEDPPKAIVVNLRSMTMDTYENDVFRKRYPVLATGNPRTTPTPVGKFKVLTKYKNAFSSLSHVWMPWSMRFYKEYYIHEVPYYPSGAKVTSKYSLGCLRLGEGDAQEVYEWADLGTAVQIIDTHLAREQDSSRVYYLNEKGFKRALASQDVFHSYGNKWSDVAEVLSGQLDAYPSVELIRAEFDFKVYKLENGLKRWITDIATFEGLGYKWEEVALVNGVELESWPTSSPIR